MTHPRFPLYASQVVATSHALAAQVGRDALRDGGNAVDAAIATAIALTVLEPTSNGLGSDAFALVWDGARLHGLNGSGRAPAGWMPARFAGREAMPTRGWDSVTVPGAVDAWRVLHGRFGRLPLARLYAASIRYAREGVPVSAYLAGKWANAARAFREFPEWAETFLIAGAPPSPGAIFRNPRAAETLEALAESAGAALYTGELARRLVSASDAAGGVMTLDDLAGHEAAWVEPVDVAFAGRRVHELPPNGQGLAALIALGILEQTPLATLPPDSPDAVHLQVEAMKIAFAEAFRHIADPAYMERSPADFLTPEYLATRASQIRLDRAGSPGPSPPPDHGTVYLCAADADGMMVSFIQSNYMGWGSGIVVPETGIALQNRGAGFVLTPGHPNQVGGGKRPFHTIIPGFITHAGAAEAAFGVMGGHMQAQGHTQVAIRLLQQQLDPQAALDAPRWFIGSDGRLHLERSVAPAVATELARRGHPLAAPLTSFYGRGQVIRRHATTYIAGTEPRTDGAAVGL